MMAHSAILSQTTSTTDSHRLVFTQHRVVEIQQYTALNGKVNMAQLEACFMLGGLSPLLQYWKCKTAPNLISYNAINSR